jgi:hypothetical protein
VCRVDPAAGRPRAETRKKYLQVACTSLLTCYFLGDRDLASFKDFIYSDLHGTVVVHDRYVNYDSFSYASRVKTSRKVTAIRAAASTRKMPASMPWKAQNLPAGW